MPEFGIGVAQRTGATVLIRMNVVHAVAICKRRPRGGETAAASSGQGTGTSGGSDSSNQMASGDQMASASGGGYDDAVKRAEAALASGDEAACLAAVQEARGMQGSSASQ